MKNKIVGIFISIIFVVATVLPAAGITNQDTKSNRYTGLEISSIGQVKDQFQETCYMCDFFPNYAWQQFVPTISKLLWVDVSIATHFSGSPDLTLFIQRPLGNVLSQKSLPASAIPYGQCDWVTFDIPDVTLTPGETYYIVLSYPLGGEYSWCGTWGNLYPKGESDKHPDWDWCFRTWASSTGEIESAPILDFINLKVGLLGILDILNLKIGLLGFSVVLKNFGEETAHNVKWEMNVVGGSPFIPSMVDGEFEQIEPEEEEIINIFPIFGFGRPTFQFHCTYKMKLNSLKSEVDAGTKQDYQGLALGGGYMFPDEMQPEMEWIRIENTEYDEDEDGNLLVRLSNDPGDMVPNSWKNVRVLDSISGAEVYSNFCKFAEGEGVVYEDHQTYGNILSGDYWEVEIETS
jgi:hypothetical protein